MLNTIEPSKIRYPSMAIEVYEEDWNRISGHSRRARDFRVLLNQDLLIEVIASVSAESWGTSKSNKKFDQMMALRLEEPDFVKRVTNQGLAEDAKLKQLSNSWRRWGNDPDSFFTITLC